MAVAGALIGRWLGAFGEKPKIPKLPSIDPTKVQADTISGNLANMPKAEELATAGTTANAAQIRKALEMALPGVFGQIEKNIGAQVRGQIPQDVAMEIQRLAAGTGFDLGVMGPVGTLGGNITPQNLGIASLDLMQAGQQNFQSLSQPFLGAAVPVQNMWFSPQQRLSFALEDRAQTFQRDLMAEQVRAAPNPADVALSQEIDRFFNTWAQFGMASLGGAGGMGGGGGGGSAVPGLTGGRGIG